MASTTEYDPENLRRLGELLEARRGELGHESRPAFEKATGLNTRLAADLEKGYRGNFKPDTIGRAATAYQVTSGSMTAVLRGEATELAPVEAVPPPAPPGRMPDWMTAGERSRLQYWSDRIWMRLVECGKHATGAQLFGEGTPDARTWEALKARGVWDVPELVAILADVHYREAAGGSSASGTA